MRGVVLWCFCIVGALGSYKHFLDDDNNPRPLCNPYAPDSPGWGPQNIFANLYEKVYQPFLNSFMYTTMCTHRSLVPAACEEVFDSGYFKERCERVGITTAWSYWAAVAKWTFNWDVRTWRWFPWQVDAETKTSLDLLEPCGIVVRKGDLSFQKHRECRRSTQVMQCVGNNALVWIALPIVIFSSIGFIVVTFSLAVLCMYLVEEI